jgi:L-seryl-tRNA(Ser) seleniumtransferase
VIIEVSIHFLFSLGGSYMLESVRFIPPIHELQKSEPFIHLLNQYKISYDQLSTILKNEIHTIRHSLLENKREEPVPGTPKFLTDLFSNIEKIVQRNYHFSLRKVINGTGTILHTNLGRALLSEESISHVVETSINYTNLEYDLENGTRGKRHDHVENIIKELTGAEAALVVNNNAAAVYFILNAFAKEKEVIVSRGELVEIGGSFRVSSIMEESGAKLVEVGTTNRTHLFDYENAIHEHTAMIMKVHTSNFIMKGFTSSVESETLIDLKKQYDHIIFYEDLGSGVLINLHDYGIGDEPVVSNRLKMGIDLVSFSGDKLLGGPQAGIIAGKKELINQLKRHQLARVLRVDKMTLAALEATLLHYLKGEAMSKIPTLNSIMMDSNMIKKRVEAFKNKLLSDRDDFEISIREDVSRIGGGTMPDVDLKTYVLSLKHKEIKTKDLEQLLRTRTPAILSRIQQDELLLDFRTIRVEEENTLLEGLLKVPGH